MYIDHNQMKTNLSWVWVWVVVVLGVGGWAMSLSEYEEMEK